MPFQSSIGASAKGSWSISSWVEGGNSEVFLPTLPVPHPEKDWKKAEWTRFTGCSHATDSWTRDSSHCMSPSVRNILPCTCLVLGNRSDGDRFQLLLRPLTVLICHVPSTGEHRSPSQQVLFFLCCGNKGAHSCFCLAYRLQSPECYFPRAVLGSLERVEPQSCPESSFGFGSFPHCQPPWLPGVTGPDDCLSHQENRIPWKQP